MSEVEAAGDNVNNEESNPPENKTENKNEEEQLEPPKEMKAVVLAGFGGLKSVKVMKKSQPSVGEGEILIRVKACGLNFLDVMVRQGVIDSPPKTPFILGFECAGEVESVGEGVTDVKVGDRVAALTEYKAWAEFVSVPAKYVYTLPQGMEFQNAASLLMNYVVAYILVFDIGNIRSGQSVLVHSAGGGVGQAVSQLCKTVSDVTLIGTASKHKHESIKDSFTHLLDHGVDYVQEIKKLSPEGVDIVLDCLYGDDANKGYNLLKPLGRYILYGSANIVTGETKSFFSLAKSVPEAMQKLHDRKNVGKIILDPSMEPKPKPKLQTKGSKDKEKDKDGKVAGETAAGESTDAEKEKEGDSSAPSSAN
ncbi:synaptic vesicle membrane protein VAT-1 homolog-like isoform X3 [Tachypleus tridentatus]|uniref:synaptic vesicle membrane protein VAT-1 homolog-like isoform X3 n=1 Tax=Tachypleus tridentatus TaxID=6853 RepID=UPI003FD02EA6